MLRHHLGSVCISPSLDDLVLFFDFEDVLMRIRRHVDGDDDVLVALDDSKDMF